ncbi:tryptophan synthase beta subunit-like PLP-dependent enzyme [Aspergillus undulatus]|uniref:tryptophan synthase beta subunit-like PLP-dependent enzyme n=1 Tax=Aspergillus undulatus TaxID=1810928 RepID=UPI003CCCD761
MADLATCPPLTRQSVIEAHELIKTHVHYTPVVTSQNLQRIGAFKARGAFHAIERLKREPDWLENGGLVRGVVGFSAGNRAQAVALAARESNMPGYIVMPETSSAVKMKSVKGYGANLTLSGRFEREAVAAQIIGKTGARLIPTRRSPRCHSWPGSGSSLLSGTALSCEGTGTRVYGAEPEFEGADDGRGDGLIGKLGVHPWGIIYERRLLNMMYAVSEEEILEAMKLIFERLKLVVEPAAAVPLAVALYNEEFREAVEREAGEACWDVGIILSGGNVGAERTAELFD